LASGRDKSTTMALENANQLILPLLRAAKQLARTYEAYTRIALKPYHVYTSGDRRIHVFTLSMPQGRILVFAVYSSAQQTRPASPAQVERRLRRLARSTHEQVNGVGADIVYIYLSTTRLTRNAYRLAREKGVFVALSPSAARALISRFLRDRFRRLMLKTRGRIWGPVALLALTLHVLAKSLKEEDGDTDTAELLASLAKRRGPPR